MIQQFEQLIAELLSTDVQTVARWLTALIIIAAIFALRAALSQLIEQRIEDVQTRHRWRRSISYITLFIAFIVGASIIVQEVQSFFTALGLIGAGLAIILRDPIVNFIGWLFIVSIRPYEIGNRIHIDESKGDVIDIQLFQTVLLEVGEWVDAEQSTGRVLYVPNQQIFTRPLANYHAGIGYIWHEIDLVITFESDWAKAEKLIHAIAERHQETILAEARKGIKGAQHRYPIMYAHLEPGVFLKVVSNGVKMTLRYLSDPRARRTSEHVLWSDVLETFNQHDDIQFAYPTTRFFGSESKKGRP